MTIKISKKMLDKLKNMQRPSFNLNEPIECSLVPIDEFSHIPGENKRFGRYAQSTYSLSKFGKNSFVVVAYLDIDLKKYRSKNVTDRDILEKCVEFLNISEEKKKGQRKEPKKQYGNLQLYNYCVINKFGREIVAIELVTDTRTNENFWGVGNR